MQPKYKQIKRLERKKNKITDDHAISLHNTKDYSKHILLINVFPSSISHDTSETPQGPAILILRQRLGRQRQRKMSSSRAFYEK